MESGGIHGEIILFCISSIQRKKSAGLFLPEARIVVFFLQIPINLKTPYIWWLKLHQVGVFFA